MLVKKEKDDSKLMRGLYMDVFLWKLRGAN